MNTPTSKTTITITTNYPPEQIYLKYSPELRIVFGVIITAGKRKIRMALINDDDDDDDDDDDGYDIDNHLPIRTMILPDFSVSIMTDQITRKIRPGQRQRWGQITIEAALADK